MRRTDRLDETVRSRTLLAGEEEDIRGVRGSGSSNTAGGRDPNTSGIGYHLCVAWWLCVGVRTHLTTQLDHLEMFDILRPRFKI